MTSSCSPTIINCWILLAITSGSLLHSCYGRAVLYDNNTNDQSWWCHFNATSTANKQNHLKHAASKLFDYIKLEKLNNYQPYITHNCTIKPSICCFQQGQSPTKFKGSLLGYVATRYPFLKELNTMYQTVMQRMWIHMEMHGKSNYSGVEYFAVGSLLNSLLFNMESYVSKMHLHVPYVYTYIYTFMYIRTCSSEKC